MLLSDTCRTYNALSRTINTLNNRLTTFTGQVYRNWSELAAYTATDLCTVTNDFRAPSKKYNVTQND